MVAGLGPHFFTRSLRRWYLVLQRSKISSKCFLKLRWESKVMPRCHMVSYRMRKLKRLTAQFADEPVEYAIKGRSIQYELFECAIKGKSM